ncbi:hypothetical protein MAR_014462 [Mya arenaria]|uniref:Uncharacterized protein n=1 Tax=Mya arenaria TaxID=6604 RepID=A0ABY7G2U3_MYAAR|nr:hypothetical protein MAR_014462 [Mya arenaria]
MTLETNKPHKSMILVYLQCYFVTIATILGTGILGLPVTLTHAGLYPFLISFILGSIIQEDPYPIGEETEFLMDEDIDDLQDEASGPVLAGHVIIPKDINIQPPNLHLLGNQFLPCGLRQFFDIILVLQFYRFIIPVFVWVLTLAIVFALKFIQPIVSVLTFFKGSLLLGTVIVTFYVGASVHREIINDYSYFGAPFLMGTVALGGVVNVMPMSWAVLDIVPQLEKYTCEGGNTTTCYNDVSLERRLKIPLPLPPVVYYLVYIIPVYFGFAVGYDVYNTIRDIIVEQSGTSQGKIITQGITGVAKNITKSFNVTSSVMSSTLPMTSSNVTVSSLLENVTSSTLVQHLVSTVKDFTGGGR